MRRRQFVLSLALASLAPALSAQQKYPSKPIKFVVPFAAGGGGDSQDEEEGVHGSRG